MPGKAAPAIQWIRPAKQERARHTAERFLAALEEALGEKSFRETSVAEIASRAQSSVGAFYARFKDKDALLHALHESFCAESMATAEQGLDPARWEGVPLDEVVSAFASFLVAHYAERRGLRRAIAEVQWIDPRFRQRAAELSAFVSRRLAALLALRRDEMRHDDPVIAAEMCHRIAFSLLDLHVEYGDVVPGAVRIDDETLLRELVRACSGYLGVASSTKQAKTRRKEGGAHARAGESLGAGGRGGARGRLRR